MTGTTPEMLDAWKRLNILLDSKSPHTLDTIERASDEIERLRKAHARMKAEAAAIADALGARGLIDFADDVRMLTKL